MMFTRYAYLPLAIILSVFIPTPVFADFVDFYDNATMEKEFNVCRDEKMKCSWKCSRGNESLKGEHTKCEKKCHQSFVGCSGRTVDKNLKYARLPKDAKKIIDKLRAKKLSKYNACYKKSRSCYKSCSKKAVEYAKTKSKKKVKKKVKSREEAELWDSQMDKHAARMLDVKQFDKKELKARSKIYSQKQLAKLGKYYSEAYDKKYDACVTEVCEVKLQTCLDAADKAYLKSLSKGDKRKNLDEITAGKKP